MVNRGMLAKGAGRRTLHASGEKNRWIDSHGAGTDLHQEYHGGRSRDIIVQQRPGRGVENNGGDKMAVARVTEIIASSTKGFEDAINEGLDRANKTLRGITGIHVISLKAAVENGKISEYRAQMNITFILEE